MQNIVVDMCEKFHNDRLRNDRALVLWKCDNNTKKKHRNNDDDDNNNKVGSAWDPFPGPTIQLEPAAYGVVPCKELTAAAHASVDATI